VGGGGEGGGGAGGIDRAGSEHFGRDTSRFTTLLLNSLTRINQSHMIAGKLRKSNTPTKCSVKVSEKEDVQGGNFLEEATCLSRSGAETT